MSETLSAFAGLSFWLDVPFGILLAVALTVTAELLARYAAAPARRSQSHALQSPALSGGEVSSAQLFSHP
jgi:hypothetical protein